jgi:hypothetical protein
MGSELGVFRTDNAADSWERIDSPLNDCSIWSILLWPGNPDIMLAGGCPSRVMVSGDAGRSWQETTPGFLQDCTRIIHTRVTALAADSTDAKTVWAGVEIDSAWRSGDGGHTWQKVPDGLSSQDIHSFAIVPASPKRPRRILAATNNDVNISDDDGDHWRKLELGKRLPRAYYRGMAQVVGRPERLLLGIGDGPPGWSGFIALSDDAGDNWRVAEIPGPANSTIWNFATHPADPSLIFASSVSGQLYRSTDAGSSWTKLPREFGEIRALAWIPQVG